MDSDGEGSPGRPSAGRAQVSGVVMETLPSALYKVRLELSPVDFKRGRIVEKISGR